MGMRSLGDLLLILKQLKTRSIDEVLIGVEASDFGIEKEVFTPKLALQHLQVWSEMRHSFNDWMQAMHNLVGSVNQAHTRPNMDVGTISVPILQQFDEVAVNNIEHESYSDSISS